MKIKHWDIFCKIVDNYGDIGVCWRLAKQLQNEYGASIRLFVSDLVVARDILVRISDEAVQEYQGITLVRWDEDTEFNVAAGIVLETFSCGLPEAYLAKMKPETIWVNVDHLSAEPWVPEFHALNGKHKDTNFTRHFFFPGFEEETGGLLREEGLVPQRDVFQHSANMQAEFWQSFDIKVADDDLKISLFSYKKTPIDVLLATLAESEQRISIFMPFNDCLPERLLGNENLAAGDYLTAGNLTVHILPFLTLEDYDKLLWACDLNFVRGEESWIRAVWAAKPFIWQPYLQVDNAHLVKLNAFLKVFYDGFAHRQATAALHQAWSVNEFYPDIWHQYLPNLSAMAQHTKQESDALLQQASLVPKLVAFCDNLAN